MSNPIDFDSDGKVTPKDAVAFYKAFPFYAGMILGAFAWQVIRWLLKISF